MVSPGVNQLEGTASDWNTVQNFAALRSDKGQIVLVSPETPLMQFGGINTGRYEQQGRPQSRQIFSWVLNNYWTTNFRAAQEGEMSWSYVLTSAADASNEFASRFGWGVRVPLISRVLPAQAIVEGGMSTAGGRHGGFAAGAAPLLPKSAGHLNAAGPGMAAGPAKAQTTSSPSFWPFAPVAVILIASHPLEKGVLLHLREVAGEPATLRLQEATDGWIVEECDPFGRSRRPARAVTFRPYEVKFVRVETGHSGKK